MQNPATPTPSTTTPSDALVGLIPSEWLPHAMLAAGIALVTLVMLRIWWKRRKRMAQRDREDAAMSAKDKMERMRTEARRDDPKGADIRALMLQAEELVRAASAQLNTKAARLERLIEEANATIERLEEAESGERVRPAMRQATGPVTDDQLSGVGFPLERTPVRTKPEAIERSLERSTAQSSDDPIVDRVMDLSRRGYSPVQIAQELNEQVGRVELMLALRRA